MQVTNEDIAEMSPDQVAALQKQNCIFCHIISGKVSSKKVFEDAQCIAVLDINPANPGHVLLMPKEHYSILPLIPDDLVQHMGQISKYISQACLKVLKAQGTSIFIANGAIAGQKAPHFMIHIIPRRDGDDVMGLTLPQQRVDEASMAAMQQSLTAAICEVLKCPPPRPRAGQEVLAVPIAPASAAPEPAPLPAPLPDELEVLKDVADDEDDEDEQPEPRIALDDKQPLGKLNIDELANAILSKPSLTAPPTRPRPAALPQAEPERKPGKPFEGFVASTQSNKIHALNCPLAKKIKKENIARFETKQEAIDIGYEECDCVRDII